MTAPLESGRAGSHPRARAIRASVGAPLILGIVVGASSWIVPLSYDEGNWLAVTRRVALGEDLYRSITDNKPPVLFGLVRALDVMPGQYPIARGVFLGLAAGLLAWLCTRILAGLGFPDRTARMLGITVGLAGALQAVLVVNFELPAVLLVVGGIALLLSDSALLGGFLAGLAVTLDLRAAVILPGATLLAYFWRGREHAIRFGTAIAVPVLAWGTLILAHSGLRYSLLELNVATRGGGAAWRPGQQVLAFARAMVFPIVGLAALTVARTDEDRRRVIPASALLAGGIAAALVSIQPFDKYWTLTLPGLVTLAAARAPRVTSDMTKVGFLLCVALVPPAVYAATSSSDQAKIVARYDRASRDVVKMLGPDGTFVRFDSNPFLGTFLPDRDLTPAAVLDFLIAPTSHERANLAAVDDALQRATAIVDDGALAVPSRDVLPAYRRLQALFAARLGDFPCIRRTNGLTVRLRPDRCS